MKASQFENHSFCQEHKALSQIKAKKRVFVELH